MKVSCLLSSFALCLLCACASLPPTPSADAPAPVSPVQRDSVVLISIDGLRVDALGKGHSPNLDRLAAAGVQARWMTPSYPTITFPNHYSMVTGLRPDRHGIVHNQM